MGESTPPERRLGDAEIRRLVHEYHQAERRELEPLITWVRDQIQEQKRRRERWEKLQGTVIGQVVLWLLIGVGYAIYEWARAKVRLWSSGGGS